MNKVVYDLLLKLEQCDDRHNKCDYLMEHDEITYLLEHIEEKDKEIERLNNILDELDNKLCSTWQLYYDHSRLTTFKCEDMLYLIEQIRKDIEKLKEDKK